MKNTNHKVVSEKQLAANRRNAKRSTGPRTDAGRAASKFNAVKHGILSRDLLVRGINYNEDPEQFKELHQSFFDYLQPHGPLEEMLVDQIVTANWRLRRVIIAESAEIARNVDDKDLNPPDLITPVVWLAQSPISMFKIEQLYAGNLILEPYFRELLQILENNGELTQADVTTTNKRYFPATSNTLTDEMDDLIKALATSDLDLDPAVRKEVQKDRVMTLLTKKIEAAVQRADKCQEREERVYQARLRAAVLPYEAVLEKIQRYETRLQRQLTRAMTDLERIQSARKSQQESDEVDAPLPPEGRALRVPDFVPNAQSAQTNPFSGQRASDHSQLTTLNCQPTEGVPDLTSQPSTNNSKVVETNPFTPPPVRVPPSGGPGAPQTTSAQTNQSVADLEPAAAIPSEGRALRVPDLISQLTTTNSQLSSVPSTPANQTNPFTPPPVRVPPSGGSGASPTTADQTNPFPSDLESAHVPLLPETLSAKRTHLDSQLP